MSLDIRSQRLDVPCNKVLPVFFIVMLSVSFLNSFGQKEMPMSGDSIEYRIQIGVMKDSLPPGWRKTLDELEILDQVIITKSKNGYFRYELGTFKLVSRAKSELEKVKKSGVSDAFIVAYYNGERVNFNHPIKYLEH